MWNYWIRWQARTMFYCKINKLTEEMLRKTFLRTFQIEERLQLNPWQM